MEEGANVSPVRFLIAWVAAEIRRCLSFTSEKMSLAEPFKKMEHEFVFFDVKISI